MAPTGGVPGRTGPDDGVERPTLLAEAVTRWELQDEIALHVLGRPWHDDDLRSPYGFVRAVSRRVGDGGLTGLAAAGTVAVAVRPPGDELPSGSRVEHWRRRRGLTRHDVARRMGRSGAWVAAIEEGAERISAVDTARRIAAALRIDLPLLLGRDPRPQFLLENDPLGAEIERVREFLERTDAMAPAPVAAIPSTAAITGMLRTAWQNFQQVEYGRLMRALPRLLRDAAVSDGARAGGPDAPEAARLLSQVYRLTAVALHKLGEYHLSWLTADRAIETARRGRDPLLAATALRAVSAALLALGRTAAARDVTTTDLPVSGRLDDSWLVVRGALLLQSASAAARTGDALTTRELLFSADIVAARLGRDTVRYETWFGPTSIELARVSTAVDLGEGADAIAVHHRLNQARLNDLTCEQHAGHYLTLARAHLQTGAADRAAAAFQTGARLAPGESRNPLHQAIRLQIQAA
jgi:transcriptional regulator with XRE-family HTH domain